MTHAGGGSVRLVWPELLTFSAPLTASNLLWKPGLIHSSNARLCVHNFIELLTQSAHSENMRDYYVSPNRVA